MRCSFWEPDAVEQLEHRRKAWSLAYLIWHPSLDVGLRAANALVRLHDRRVASFLLASADQLAGPVSGSEGATLHLQLLRALARALDALCPEPGAGCTILLKEGGDKCGYELDYYLGPGDISWL